MPTQYTYGSSKDKYKKKLFIETFNGFVEVGAKIIEPYLAPTPNLNTRELKIINAPSHFQQMGISSYNCSLTLLFKDKAALADYMAYAGWTHKFYDEKGLIYTGPVTGIKTRPAEASTKFVVEINLILIKKADVEREKEIVFTDLVDDDTGNPHWAKEDIEEFARLNIVSSYWSDGSPVLYFRPSEFMTRGELVAAVMRTKRIMEKFLRQ